MAEILQVRVIGHASEEAWFVDHGMPADGRAVVRRPTPPELRGLALLNDPAFRHWIETDGTRVYAEFLATHPAYVMKTSLDDRRPVHTMFSGVTGSSGVGSARTVVPPSCRACSGRCGRARRARSRSWSCSRSASCA